MTGPLNTSGDDPSKLPPPIDLQLEESCASRLAQANLHRLRRQWDEANRVCLHVLYAAPDSWRAHALLGDIAAERGDADEAIRWYCMALDIRPDAQATREKLSLIVNSRRAELNKTITTQVGNQLSRPASFNLMRTLSTPTARRAGIAVATGVIGVVGLCLLTAPLRSSQAQRQIIEPAFTPTSTTYALDRPGGVSAQPSAAAATQPQSPALVTTLAAPSPASSASTLAQHAPASSSSSSASSMVDSDEAKLSASLQRDPSLRSLGVSIDNCVIDPSSQAAILTVSAESVQPTTQQTVLASAEAVAKSALSQSAAPPIQQCTVRVMASLAGTQTIIFQGVAPKLAAQQNGAAPTAISSVFTSVWWSPSFNTLQSNPLRGQSLPAASPTANVAPLNS